MDKPLIDVDELLAAVEDSLFGTGSDGFCISCGMQQGGCEPDARNYPCENCDDLQVFGAQELLIMGYGGI